jgi:hypothetical protein
VHFGRDADAVVGHREAHHRYLVPGRLPFFDPYLDPAVVFGELYGVGDQVVDHLENLSESMAR